MLRIVVFIILMVGEFWMVWVVVGFGVFVLVIVWYIIIVVSIIRIGRV